eukprot:167652_1
MASNKRTQLIIDKVLKLTPMEVHSLPATEQAQAMYIRNKYLSAPVVPPPLKKQKISSHKITIRKNDNDDNSYQLNESDIELDEDEVLMTNIVSNWSNSAHFKNGMKGKRFGYRGASFGYLGAIDGSLTAITPRKARTSFSVFEKLHAIVRNRNWGPALTVIWKWGSMQNKQERKQYTKYIKNWTKNETELIKESLKVNGLKHRAVSTACHSIFTLQEANYIKEKFDDVWDRGLPITESDIVGWGWECASKYNKLDRYQGKSTWVRDWCEKHNISIQKYAIKRHPASVPGFEEIRDEIIGDVIRAIFEYKIPPKNVKNFDHTGLHFDMLCKKTLAPVGEGQYQDPSTYKGRDRYTLTIGTNGEGRIEKPTMTFKEKHGVFGPRVRAALENDPNTKYIWIQASSSGLQEGYCVDDMVTNCWGTSIEIELYILDAYGPWTSEANAEKIHFDGNKFIVKLLENTTAFLQFMDRAFFGVYKGLERKRYKEFLQKQANMFSQQPAGTKCKFTPRTRHDCIADCHSILCQMQFEQFGNFQTEWKRLGMISAFDATEDDLLHENLCGTPTARKLHYKNVIKMPQTAEDRLNMSLPTGRREYIIGTRNIYVHEDTESDESSVESTNADKPSFMIKIRENIKRELGDKTKWTGYPQTKTPILKNIPSEWLLDEVPYIASATSFYKGHGSHTVHIPKHLPTLQPIIDAKIKVILPLSKTVTTKNEIAINAKKTLKEQRNENMIRQKKYHLVSVKIMQVEIRKRNSTRSIKNKLKISGSKNEIIKRLEDDDQKIQQTTINNAFSYADKDDMQKIETLNTDPFQTTINIANNAFADSSDDNNDIDMNSYISKNNNSISYSYSGNNIDNINNINNINNTYSSTSVCNSMSYGYGNNVGVININNVYSLNNMFNNDDKALQRALEVSKKEAEMMRNVLEYRQRIGTAFNSKVSTAPQQAYGTMALQNLRNTCYFNSIIQALLHCPPFHQYFINKTYLSDINTQNVFSNKGIVVKAWDKLFQKAFVDKKEVVSPWEFVNIVISLKQQFKNYEQHDSSELLFEVLDLFHRDVNIINVSPNVTHIFGKTFFDQMDCL